MKKLLIAGALVAIAFSGSAFADDDDDDRGREARKESQEARREALKDHREAIREYEKDRREYEKERRQDIDRKSGGKGKGVAVRVERGGRRIIKKTKGKKK